MVSLKFILWLNYANRRLPAVIAGSIALHLFVK
jgi:hypothetical protein